MRMAIIAYSSSLEWALTKRQVVAVFEAWSRLHTENIFRLTADDRIVLKI